jgi:hypothetical protein
VIGSILPPEVAAEEAFGDLTGITLFPEEEAAIAQAVAVGANEPLHGARISRTGRGRERGIPCRKSGQR